MKLTFLILLAAMLSGLGAAAQQPRGDLSRVSLVQLLDDLGSSDFQRRSLASGELLRRGPAVSKELRQRLGSLRLEARLRVREILDQLSSQAAHRSLSSTPSLITLDLHDQPLRKILQALGDQAGIPIKLTAATPGGVPSQDAGSIASLKVKQLSFFAALDQLCRQQELIFQRDGRTGSLLLRPGSPAVGPVVYPGPFRAEIARFSVTRQLLSSGQHSVNAYLQIQVDVENRAAVLGVLTPLAPTRVLDDQGRSLMPVTVPRNFYLMPQSARHQFQLSLTISPPARDAHHLRELICPLRFAVPIDVSVARLSAPFSAGQKPESGTPLGLTLDKFATKGDQTMLSLSFETTKAEGPALGNGRVIPPVTLTFQDREGNQVAPVRRTQRSLRGRQVRELVLPTKTLASIRLRSVETYDIRELQLAFKDVPIP